MTIVLETLSTTHRLDVLEKAIRQPESLGYELIALGQGMVGGTVANLPTFRRGKPGDAPAMVADLLRVDGQTGMDNQEGLLNHAEYSGRCVFSFASRLVEGTEINVAAHRNESRIPILYG